MGYYVNPEDGRSKEQWLEDEGELINYNQAAYLLTEGDRLPVCLVDNGFFTAAGIGYCLAEVEEFQRPCGRPKKWYSVPRKALELWYKE